MAAIKVGGSRFYIEPDSASWTYAMKIIPKDTYGGRVTQLLACTIEGLSVEGYIRPKRISEAPHKTDREKNMLQWQGLREFEYNVARIMQYHEDTGDPVKFEFDEIGWNGIDGDEAKVFLTGYNDVRFERDLPAVRYRLSFDVHSGFGSIVKAASDQGLSNIPEGVGWVRSVYNTPELSSMSWETLKSAMEDAVDDAGTHDASKPMDIYEYLSGSGDDADADEKKKKNSDNGSDSESKGNSQNKKNQDRVDSNTKKIVNSAPGSVNEKIMKSWGLI